MRTGAKASACIFLALTFSAVIPPVMGEAPPVPLAPGAWLEVKGSFAAGSVTFMARDVELSDDRKPALKGPLDGFDAESGEIRMGPFRLRLEAETRLEGASEGGSLLLELVPGRRVKVSLRPSPEGGFRVRRLRVLDGRAGRLHLEGQVESFLPQEEGGSRFRLLGVEIRTGSRTRWRGVVATSVDVDDEDQRPAEGLMLGWLGRFSGEVRADFKDQENFDLFDDLDRDLETRRLRTRLELTLPPHGHLSGMVQVEAQNESAVRDQAGLFQDRSQFTLGKTYLLLSGVLGRRGSLMVGRSRFDDSRDWLYNINLDAVRFFFDTARFHLESSISRQLIDPSRRQKDITNGLLMASFYPGRGHTLSAYFFNRHDGHRDLKGVRRDFSPRYVGVSAHRKRGGAWNYWLEAVQVRGRDGQFSLRGHALDAGVTLVAPLAGRPSLTVGYAAGSGDDHPGDGVNRTFRQTGLQLNNGKWDGVTNFRFYGELLRPELANIRIETLGLGLRPRRKTSLDLVFHRYRLDKPSSSLVRSAIKDRRLNFMDLDIGREWDLVAGFEEMSHLEFELDLGYFSPGKAFLGPTDGAVTVRFKAKVVF
ncbi:MAG: alginate export family protein [Acidobacteriota bacterium]